MTTKLLLTRVEAAQLLSISERTLFTLTKEGTIPCIRLGHSVRYDVASLRKWISEQSQTGTYGESPVG